MKGVLVVKDNDDRELTPGSLSSVLRNIFRDVLMLLPRAHPRKGLGGLIPPLPMNYAPVPFCLAALT